MLSALLALSLALAAGTEARTEPEAEVPVRPVGAETAAAPGDAGLQASRKAFDDGRLVGWEVAWMLLDQIGKSDEQKFPGIAAFVRDAEELRKKIGDRKSPRDWPAFDPDALLSRNPDYWRMVYEIAPADPSVAFVTAGLLLSGGEAHRAGQVLRVALQAPGIPEQVREMLKKLHGTAMGVMAPGEELVKTGIAIYDRGDVDGAEKVFQAAVGCWPQNSWAHYETGLCRMTRQVKAEGGKLEMDALKINEGSERGADLAAPHYTLTRKHNPFMWQAYQGRDHQVISCMLPLLEEVLPLHKKLCEGQLSDQDTAAFSAGLLKARIYDLALAGRQVVVARRGRFAPEDHPFITSCLRTLCPGGETDKVLDRLAKGTIALRVIVKTGNRWQPPGGDDAVRPDGGDGDAPEPDGEKR